MFRMFVAVLALATAVPAATRADEWESLFNGRDLTGWKGKAELWSVKDGAITGYTKDGKIPGGNSFLVWDGTVKDFELKVQFKISGGNSGIQYRSKTFDKSEDFHIGGYQADIDGSKGGGYYGITYEERGRGIICNRGTKTWIGEDGTLNELRVANAADVLKAITPEWNEYHIVANGNVLTQKINGTITAQVVDFQKDKRAMEGLLAFQIHANMGEMTVQFKDVKLKKLSDGVVLTPETAPIDKDAKVTGGPKKKK